MKIVIINPIGHKSRGIGFYTLRLVEALKLLPKVEVETVDNAHIPSDADLIHFPYFQPYVATFPIKKSKPTVITIHDLTPVLFKEHFPPGIKGEIKWQIQKFLLHRNVAAVITDSECSKNDIARLTNYPRGKIFVVKLAADEIFKYIDPLSLQPAETEGWQSRLESLKSQYRLPDKFVLYVGDVNWNKNVVGLARACKKVGIPLVIIGKQAKEEEFDRSNIENQPLVELLSEFEADPQVQRLGFVPDEDLVAIYNRAALYVQPSFYEGSGLPILEAFASGCLVASSNKGSLPEICGDAAIMFNPTKIGDTEEKIRKALSLSAKERMSYINKGLKIASNYSWQNTALATLGIYKKIVSA